MSNPSDQHNQGGLIAFVFSLVVVLGFFGYLLFVHDGVDLDENIKDPSTSGAQESRHKDVKDIAEPWVANDALVVHGKMLFSQYCAMCHGAEGKGDGAAGASLEPKPRNLTTGPWKKGGGFTGWYTVLTDGIAGSSMASFATLPAVDRWSLVQFIDSVTQAKVQEDPSKVAEFAKTAK